MYKRSLCGRLGRILETLAQAKVKNTLEIEKNIVYCLISFIEAHNCAQRDAQRNPVADPAVIKQVTDESQAEVQEAQELLDRHSL